MPSARFRSLERRVATLRKRFLPKDFSATGTYNETERDFARAFRLLAHAEIEAYIEDRARNLAIRSVARFKADGRTRTVVFALASYHLIQKQLSEQDFTELYTQSINHASTALDDAAAAYHHCLRENHGIRTINVLRVLLPVGIKVTDIDATWLSTMDSYGQLRGETAHTAVGAQQLIDPKTEFDTVTNLLQGLRDIDSAIQKLQ